MNIGEGLKNFWACKAPDILAELGTKETGLPPSEAVRRYRLYGPNTISEQRHRTALALFVNQFKSPLVLILIFAAILSSALGDALDAPIILAIILVSSVLGFWQEYGANRATADLLKIVEIKAVVRRNDKVEEIPVTHVVPGDIVILSAGDTVPADCLILESRDLLVDEAALTGETYPAEKAVGVSPATAPIAKRKNALFMGSHIMSGNAQAVVVATAKATEFGRVAGRLAERRPPTEFEIGIKRFGYFLMEVTLILVIAIFAINSYFGRPILDSFMFSLALAVGLTPQLLPAIISINLARGAKRMAESKVIVKRLESIENFGSMNVLCSDKTGTLTEGKIHVRAVTDYAGHASSAALRYAVLNASFESGYANPINDAIRRHGHLRLDHFQRLDEVPYDAGRRRLSVLVEGGEERLIVMKGSVKSVLAACSSALDEHGRVVALSKVRDTLLTQYDTFGRRGYRTLGIGYRAAKTLKTIAVGDERDLIFAGFVVLYDRPKPNIAETIHRLESRGVALKIITGDNKIVSQSVAKEIGLVNPLVLTGEELVHLTEEALMQRINAVTIFCEVEPSQKERIILALRKLGNVVGYMGDGINDAAALHAADVGVSVNTAVDVAKETADIILLENDLGVLTEGVVEGRRTFANTLKYIFMATSANFGNMFSMAGASLFLPFLPLLPKQILLTNLMTDFPEMTIATDAVDRQMVTRPHRWNIHTIRHFMVTFGLLSSIFDYATFGVLLFILGGTQAQFRTGWFVESVVSAAVIVLIIRTRLLAYKSRPSQYLLATTLFVVSAVIDLPYTRLGAAFGFVPLPLSFVWVLGIIVVSYVVSAEFVKTLFYRRAAL